MTTREAKKVPLPAFLSSLGFNPVYALKNGNELWYLSPFRTNETEPSFKITINKNSWYDFGVGEGGSILDFAIKFFACSIGDAFKIIEATNLGEVQFVASSVPHKTASIVELRSIKDLQNTHLIQLVEERGINKTLANQYIKEVYYRRNNKNYFSIGMQNNSGGWEVRTKFFKGCILNKDITTIRSGSDKVSLFEGFMDFLSLLTIKHITALKSDVIILHSTSQVKRAIDVIRQMNYKKVFTFFDNDSPGHEANQKIKAAQIPIRDMRYLYTESKDLNQHLINTISSHKNQ